MKLKEILGRLTGIKEQDTVHHGEAIMPSPFDSPRYEQELWDKVAVAYVNGAASDPDSAWTERAMNEHVSQAYNIADAFMAERAKYLKGAVK